MQKTSFHDFEFLRTLGKGAFSTVYLVKRKLDQETYALKSILMNKLKETDQQNSVNEIRILASVSHPNIVGFKEAFWNDKNKTLNIVMEYCDDGDLETKINVMKRNKQKFEESLIWEYTLQIIKGLKALHDKKILHRDLKCANIFLTKENNQCKIGDLNVSKVMKDKSLMNGQIGTPSYSSPEVWKNQPYSYKSDLWSVGCIIYEMCCLRPPFKGRTTDELCDNICNGKIEKISSRYSDDLWNLITMLLEVDTNKRPDCNSILNNDLLKNKINEIKNLYSRNYSYNEEESSFLDTIEYKSLRELEHKIPKKKKYQNKQKIVKNSNNEKRQINHKENLEETIKNDSSFDEFSISEQKPCNNINKNNTYINDNNKIFKRNSKTINNNIRVSKPFARNDNKLKNIIRKLEFNNIVFINKNKSSININFKYDLLKLKKDFELIMKSEINIINYKLIRRWKSEKVLRKKEIIENKTIKNKKKSKIGKIDKMKKEKHKFINNKQQNKLFKSGLKSLKKDIERKLTLQNLEKSPSKDKNIYQVSNSNSKLFKNNLTTTKNSEKKKILNDSSYKKNQIRYSLNEANEIKSKFNNLRKNTEVENKFKKLNSGEISNIEKKDSNKYKKSKFCSVNETIFDDKNTIRNSTNININNNNLYENSMKKEKKLNNISTLKNEKSFSQKNLFKTENNQEEEKTFRKLSKVDSKNNNKYVKKNSANLNLLQKSQNKKNNYDIKNKNSKVIEIDISQNKSNFKKSFNEGSSFNKDLKFLHNIAYTSKDLNHNKISNNKYNQRNSMKINDYSNKNFNIKNE